MIFNYDLKFRLPTYDFFFYAMHARMLGATMIQLGGAADKVYMERAPHLGWPKPREETMRRRDHYMLPSGPLIGMPVCVGEHGDKDAGSHLIRHIWADAQTRGGVPKMVSPRPPGSARYTVTLRRNWYRQACNSDEPTWRAFANEIGARVIEDHYVSPMSLFERMSLYAGARMNFGVPNGPFSILYLTDYPFMEFCDPRMDELVRGFRNQSMLPGDQIPWLGPRQAQVWETPTLGALMQAFGAADLLADTD